MLPGQQSAPLTRTPSALIGKYIRALLTSLSVAVIYFCVSGSALGQLEPPPVVTTGRLRVELDRLISRPPSSTLLNPNYLDTANDNSGRLFLTEQRGRVQVRHPNGTIGTFLDFSSEIPSPLQTPTGLLGMAFHPGYADPSSPGYRKFYTYHSGAPDPNATPDFVAPHTITQHNILTEWQVDANNPNAIDMSTRREVFREAHAGDIHHGGMLEFGPDGYLYGTIGAPQSGAQMLLYAQDLSNIQGKIFRIDPLHPSATPTSSDSPSANGKYRVPTDNPFVNTSGALDEVWALGVRHIYRFSFDPLTGKLFAGDVGQAQREEVSVVNAGDNLGWPYYEAYRNGPISPPPTLTPPHSGPIAAYAHNYGRTVIGGYLYRGSIPELQGKYIFGEFSWRDEPSDPQGYDQNLGRLLAISPFDEEGNLRTANIPIEEVFLGTSSCADSLSTVPGCHLDVTFYSMGVDDDGEIYIVGKKSSAGTGGAVLYKLADAYTLAEGDYNEDGVVDALDYTVWRNTLGDTFVSGGRGADGDRDRTVDLDDYNVWKAHYGETSTSGGSGSGGLTQSVPEPASAVLLFLGALALAWPNRFFTRFLIGAKN